MGHGSWVMGEERLVWCGKFLNRISLTFRLSDFSNQSLRMAPCAVSGAWVCEDCAGLCILGNPLARWEVGGRLDALVQHGSTAG